MTDDTAPYAPTLFERNAAYADAFDSGGGTPRPSRHLVVVTCMDARLDTFALLGLGHGEAHILRNAGGVITDDMIRSICLSQRELGTREIMLIHHTNCGLTMTDESTFRTKILDDVGVTPTWAAECFVDPFVDVAQSMRRIANSPFIPHKDQVSGFVYDVDDGRLKAVDPA